LKILVTGASGFIGSQLVKKLADSNHSVTVLKHKQNVDIPSTQVIEADLSESSFSTQDNNYDVVFHLAAATPMEKNKKLVKKINYDGTVNLFNSINDKTKSLVYISGLGVFGEPGDETVTENSPLNPNTEYSKMRLDAQKFLETNCKKNSIPFTVVYLGEVYGNGGWFTTQIIPRIKKNSFKMPKGGEYYRNFVHVDDVVTALIAIVEKNVTNDSFIITDSNPVLFKEFINHICDNLGTKHPGSIPTFLAKAVLGGDFVKLLTTSMKASNAKITKLCQFKYPSHKEGMDVVLAQLK